MDNDNYDKRNLLQINHNWTQKHYSNHFGAKNVCNNKISNNKMASWNGIVLYIVEICVIGYFWYFSEQQVYNNNSMIYDESQGCFFECCAVCWILMV